MSLINGIAVISGGSAANSLVDTFKKLADSRDNAKLSYIIGISDNGGSTSELIRVFGGPGIGDIRRLLGRLVRLVPADNGRDAGTKAIKRLLNYRLPKDDTAAKIEWLDIVDGTHEYWKEIPSEKKELLRSFFIFLAAEITKRARPSSTFNFQLASLGNLFLTGCRLFFGSLESAIYLTRSILGVPDHIHVVPAINSNFSHHIAAGLANGTVIAGQNQISHPTDEGPAPDQSTQHIVSSDSALLAQGAERVDPEDVEDANLPGSLPSLRKGQIVFTKEHEADLPARIERIWYINPYGQEIRPPANSRVLGALRDSNALIYSIGSLYTSIIPCLIVKGVGELVAESSIRFKILILNGSYDREIGPGTTFNALDFVKAITLACVESRGEIMPEIRESLLQRSEYRKYVNHIIYLDGPDVPETNVSELKELGIECWRVYGRRNERGKGMLYDSQALSQALEMILGRRMVPQSRRQTVDSTNGVFPGGLS